MKPNGENTKPLHPSASKLDVRHTYSAGRGLFVKDSTVVAAGEVIASIPVSAALVVGSGDDVEGGVCYPFEDGQWVSRDYWMAADWDVRLCVLLLYHVVGGGGGYLGWLPDEVVTAIDLPDSVLEEVAYSPLVDAVECYRYRLDREYGKLRKELGAVVSYDAFEWSLKIVHSRALAIPPGGFAGGWRRRGRIVEGRWFALVPVVDMVNHGIGKGIVGVRFNKHWQCFEVVAGEEGVGNGDQVLVSYGALTNDELYLWYGFVEAGNVNDVFEVEDVVDWVGDESCMGDWNLFEAKVALLERVGLCYEGRKFSLARGRIDPYLVAALRVLLADADEFKLMRAFAYGGGRDRGVVRGMKKDIPIEWFKSITNENERNVWGKIERQCRRLLDEFPTSIELDEEMIILHAASSVPSDPITASSLLFRVEKKRILRAAADLAVEHRIRLERAMNLYKQSKFAPPSADSWADIQ